MIACSKRVVICVILWLLRQIVAFDIRRWSSTSQAIDFMKGFFLKFGIKLVMSGN